MSDDKKTEKPMLTELEKAKARAEKANQQLREAEAKAAELADKDRKRLAALVGEKLLAAAAVNKEFNALLSALVKQTFSDAERHFFSAALQQPAQQPAQQQRETEPSTPIPG